MAKKRPLKPVNRKKTEAKDSHKVEASKRGAKKSVSKPSRALHTGKKVTGGRAALSKTRQGTSSRSPISPSRADGATVRSGNARSDDTPRPGNDRLKTDPAREGGKPSSVRSVLSAGGSAAPRGKPLASKGAGLKVAPPKVRKLPSSELAKIRELLSRKKQAITNHLQTELSELEKPEKRHRTDLEEIASDTHDTDSLCEIMDIETTQIDQIDMALAKIDNGTYGICEDCGGEIPLARLEALPFATQCIECKRKAEFQGQISAADSASRL